MLLDIWPVEDCNGRWFDTIVYIWIIIVNIRNIFTIMINYLDTGAAKLSHPQSRAPRSFPGRRTQDLAGGVGDVTGNHVFSISLRELEFKNSPSFSNSS